MRRLIQVLFLCLILSCTQALAGSYCENYMPDDYVRCNEAMSTGSHKTYGNWHLSMAGKDSELQLYPFNPVGQSDVSLVVGCQQSKPLAFLRPQAPLTEKGILRMYAKNRLIWEGSWNSNREHRFLIADFQAAIQRFYEKGVDTVKMTVLPHGHKTALSMQTYHTLGSERAMQALKCSGKH